MGVFFKKHRMAFTLPGCCAALTLLYMAAFSGVSAEGVRDALLRYGDLAPVIYMLLFAVLPAFFLPDILKPIKTKQRHGRNSNPDLIF